MILKFKARVFASIILLANFLTLDHAFAQTFTGKTLIDNISDPIIQTYLNGVAQAYAMANGENELQMADPLFCMPQTLPFDANLAETALRVAINTFGEDHHPAALILRGMQTLFPCK